MEQAGTICDRGHGIECIRKEVSPRQPFSAPSRPRVVSLSVGAGLPGAAPDEARASGHGAGNSCLALSAGGRRGGARR